MKLATIFISSTRGIFIKLLAVSESSIKIKVRSHWTLFAILLTSAIFKQRFCMETRLYNISQTENAITLVKTTLESPPSFSSFCKVLQASRKRSLNVRYNFQRSFNFRVLLTFTFWLQHIHSKNFQDYPEW